MLRVRVALVLAAVLTPVSLGCRAGDDSFTTDGTVEFVAVEGGCWRIRGGDGAPYEAVNLALAFREDGLAVRATLLPRDDVVSICQVGRPVEVLAIERR